MYDETGGNETKIKKKMEKVNHIAEEVKHSGHYNEVGKADTEVRLMLVEIVVKPTLLYNTETWIDIRVKEWEAINKGQYEMLKRVFEQRGSTPYYGIIAELGIWPYSYEVVKKRLMLFHKVINSDESRIIRKIVVNQMRMGQNGQKNWYEGVREWLIKMGMERKEEKIKEMSEAEWKNKVVEGLEKEVKREVEGKIKEMTKLRFVGEYKRQEYVGY